MSRPKAEIPLVRKVARAFQAVGKLQRRGRNTSGERSYPFTRATDVLEAVRDKLLSQDVLILPNEGTPEYVQLPTNGGGVITECRLAVTYTFQDTREKLDPIPMHGVGQCTEGKALYKAQTGAQKALLKRFGLMAEETDDPEFDGHGAPTGETLEDVAPRRVPYKQKPIRDFEITALQEAVSQTHKTDTEIFYQFGIRSWTELKRGQFKDSIKWASNGGGTLAPKLQAAPALQNSLPLSKPTSPIELRIGSKSIAFDAEKKGYAL